jgi:zinc protease
MLKIAVIWLAGVSLLTPQLSLAQVHETKLTNGMKVLVKEDHRAPVVVSQVWYKVGSSYENLGITGVSHVLEHMMFKGTAKYASGEFSRIIAENGGSENAFTGRDYTAYFQQLEKSRLPISMQLEADRMRNLTLPAEEFNKELAVVMEERRLRTDDNPRALTQEKFYATAFISSPYHNPIIGWMNDLQNLSVEDLGVWYRRWYAPNNATLVIVGDVDAQAVFELAEQYFGKLAASELKPLKPRREVPQSGMRKITVKAPAELPYLMMGYKVPVLNTASEQWEPYALEMLAGILGGSNSARFPRELVREQQIAVGVNIGYDLFARQEDLLVIEATPAQGHEIEEVKQAIEVQIERLKTELVNEDELARIKAQVVAHKVYEQDSVFYQAMQMGMLETIGLGWRKLDEYPERIRAITAEQVQAVARKYLIKDGLTVATLDPQPLNDKPLASAEQ